MNSINLTGNISHDLELKQTTGGKSVLSFNLAVNRPFTKNVTDFIPIVAWEQAAEYLAKYAHKGSKIAVSGKLTTRSYEDKNGNKRTAYEVYADGVEICESKAQAEPTVPDPRTLGGYRVLDAYSQSGLNTAQFEEISNDQALPF